MLDHLRCRRWLTWVLNSGRPGGCDYQRCETSGRGQLLVESGRCLFLVRGSRVQNATDAGRAQVGIQFVQVGDDDNASEFLRQLDDDLADAAGVRDMVDTTPYLGQKVNAEIIIKILLGGINRRVDRRGGASVM